MASGHIAEIIEILQKVKVKITDDSDVVWCGVDNPEQLRAILDYHINNLAVGKQINWGNLTLLFGPTGKLQEHSLSNGWGDEFITLSTRFDNVANSFQQQ